MFSTRNVEQISPERRLLFTLLHSPSIHWPRGLRSLRYSHDALTEKHLHTQQERNPGYLVTQSASQPCTKLIIFCITIIYFFRNIKHFMASKLAAQNWNLGRNKCFVLCASVCLFLGFMWFYSRFCFLITIRVRVLLKWTAGDI
jgi:hypothetical protein